MRIKIIFAIGNGALFLCVLFMFALPAMSSIRAGMDSYDLLNRRIAVESAYEGQTADNGTQSGGRLPSSPLFYDGLADALNDIYSLARKYSLEQTDFVLSEPVGIGEYDGAVLYEVRLRAGYEGSLGDIAEFINELHSGVPVVDSFMVGAGTAYDLTIEMVFVVLE